MKNPYLSTSIGLSLVVGLLLLTGSTAPPAQAAPAAINKSKAQPAAGDKVIVRKPPPPDYFPLRYKYWWKYDSKTNAGVKTSFKITDLHDHRMEDQSIQHEMKTDSGTFIIHDWYTKAEGMVHYLTSEYVGSKMKVDFAPDRPYIKIVMNDGDTWQWAGKGMMGVAIEESSVVSGPEDIEVPAGKFKAMKVVTQVKQGGMPATKTYWYGPNVGLVKSHSESGGVVSDTELTEYQFPKLDPGDKDHLSEYEIELRKQPWPSPDI